MSRPRSALFAGLVSAVLWVLIGGARAVVVWFGWYRGDVVSLVLPGTISPQYWQLAMPWPVLIPAASTLAVGGLVWAAAQIVLERSGSTRRGFLVLALWFVVVATGAVVGFVDGVAVLMGRGAPGSLFTVAQGLPDAIAPTLYWGLIFGWIPASVGTLGRDRPTAGTTRGPSRAVALAVGVGAVVVLLVSIATVTTQARTAGLAGELPPAVQRSTPEPLPTGTPPPARALGQHPIDPAWCVDSALSFADLGGDAATGHREHSISVTNTGRDACVLPGYPDLAFADAHGVEVGAAVHDGSGFMTHDAGPVPMTLAPGETATADLAWDATDGRSTIQDLFIAPYAGADRVLIVTANPMDITGTTEVAVTAWARQATPPS